MSKYDETLTKQAIGLLPLRINIKKLDERAVIPKYAHNGDVGMDLTAISVEYDAANDTFIYHTGISIASNYHYGVLLFPRSSNRRTNAYLANHVGIADTAIYRGEILWCFKLRDSIQTIASNTWIKTFVETNDKELADKEYKKILAKDKLEFAPYNVGERIGQMVVFPYPDVRIDVVEELSQTERGSGGFGSTGL